MTLSPSSSVHGGFPLGLTGATAATRYVGATATGAPVSGTFAVGDYVVTQDGSLYICTVAGSPGTWAQVSGGGGASDPVSDLLGTPTTAFEFASSSLAGLTAIGTPDTENADTTVPDAYFLRDNASGVAYCGRFVASPAMPFTVVTKVLDSGLTVDFNLSGLFVGVANPAAGAFLNVGVTNGTRTLARNPFTNPGSAGAATNYNFGIYNGAVYLAMVANSSTDVDILFSYNGWLWNLASDGLNPGFTIASCGIGMASVNANGYSVAFDYLRIWDSAKTFPGG